MENAGTSNAAGSDRNIACDKNPACEWDGKPVPFTAEQFVTQARTWLSTPYHHAAALKGVGADCTGLLIGAAAELGMTMNVSMKYGREDKLESLTNIFLRYSDKLPPGTPMQAGDVLMFRGRDIYHHVALYTGPETNTIIHVYETLNKVCEHVLSDQWLKLTYCVFRFRGF